MRCFILGIAVLLSITGYARAQNVTPSPICTDIVNKAPYLVFGNTLTDYYDRPDGVRARHRGNFRLKPEESAQICTSGPFYDGMRIHITLRALIPLFSCKTKIDGPIIIQGRINIDGTTESWIDCR